MTYENVGHKVVKIKQVKYVISMRADLDVLVHIFRFFGIKGSVLDENLIRISLSITAMKIFASLLVVVCMADTIYGRAVPDSLALITKGLHKECVSETKVTEDLIEKGRNGEFSEEPAFKCYLKCLLAKLNLISKTGEVDYEGMISMIPKDFMEAGSKMVNDCREITGTDNCDKAYNLNVCFYKSNPLEYFIV